MASLKEVKLRIASVNNTLKITSAMRMISSVKLRKAQQAVNGLIPYQNALKDILTETTSGVVSANSPYQNIREIKKVGIVAISSNTSLCGSFNVNIEKSVKSVLEEYSKLGTENIIIYPIGKKITKAFSKLNYTYHEADPKIIDKPAYSDCSLIASNLMDLFLNHSLDRVEIIYNHFKSTSTQIVTRELFLPIITTESELNQPGDYILEPDREAIVHVLLEKVLTFKLFSILVDSTAAEHAARTVAMQMATENAKKLIQELTVQLNKTRQQAITNELLDIMGGVSK